MKKFSSKPLSLDDENKICEAFFEEEKEWYGALIKKVDPLNQTADIEWVGFTKKDTLPAKFINVNTIQSLSH